MPDKPEEKSPPAVEQFTAPQGNHKNPAIGPKTNNTLPEWSRWRDYEQFMPTPNM